MWSEQSGLCIMKYLLDSYHFQLMLSQSQDPYGMEENRGVHWARPIRWCVVAALHLSPRRTGYILRRENPCGDAVN